MVHLISFLSQRKLFFTVAYCPRHAVFRPGERLLLNPHIMLDRCAKSFQASRSFLGIKLRTFAEMLPPHYANEGLRASMVLHDNENALRYAVSTGLSATVVFILGIMATRREEGK